MPPRSDHEPRPRPTSRRRRALPSAFAALLALAAARSSLPIGLDGDLASLTEPLYTTLTLHVDPGPGPAGWSSESGWTDMKLRLDALATMMEERGLGLTVACSENFILGCDTWSVPGVAPIDDPGTLTNLAARGHDIEYHRHGGDIVDMTSRIATLTGTAPVVLEGFATHDELVDNGYGMLGGAPKDVASQLFDVTTRPMRVHGDDPFEEATGSPILRGAGGPYEGYGYEPDSLDQMTKALEHTLAHRDAGKIQVHGLCLTHPDEFPLATLEDDVAALGEWIDVEVLPRIASNALVHVKKRELIPIYAQWEALGGTNDDLFPSAAPPARASFVRHDSGNSGLSNDAVADIHRDAQDRLWFGHARSADGGISRLDPDGSWTGFDTSDGLSSGLTLFLFEGALAEMHAISGRDLADETSSASFATLTPIGWQATPPAALGSNGFLWEGFSRPNGDLYVGQGNGLSRRIDGSWDVLTPFNSPLPFPRVYAVEDTGSEIWLATMGGGLAILDDGGTPAQDDDSWVFHTEESTGGALLAQTLRDVEFDSSGGAWIATQFGASYLAPDGTWTAFTPDDTGLGYHHVACVLVDSQDDVWFGTYGRGVSRLQPDTGLWDVYTRSDGFLGNDFVTDIEEDADGDVWMAAFHGGGATELRRRLRIPTPPFIGGELAIELRGDVGTATYSVVSLQALSFELAGWGTVEIDPAWIVADAGGPIGASGSLELSWPVPPIPALQGVVLYLQAAVGDELTHREQTRIL